ncbi:MFS transporter [Martelella mediterranea]|uniref:EmrB/QacA subfamily drug resistance transporter n=1 Tax=Martelella mediterranea TaxID=293089 RepID=A0A4R3P1F4_9HYPH|nr:MFS transporter [Martelella mediterranea]TCT43069.1 EmrB/QacA subfamily drug resistance transporter [Martelella mediterranea]
MASISNATTPTSVQETGENPERWIALAVLLSAVFMNMLDVTIVNVALPSIQEGLNASSTAIEWIVAGYVLVFALALLPFGRLGDIMGKKNVFLVGVACFTIGSALCGLSHTTGMLVASRFFQGFAAAIMTPQVLALAQVMFSSSERARAFSFFGMTAGLATVSGPVIGGLLIDHDVFGLGWRAIFLINLPIGVLAVLAGWKLVPSTPRRPGARNDLPGIILIAVAMFMLIFPLVEGRTYGWPWWCFALMIGAIPLLSAFVLWERKQSRFNAPQLLSYSLMKNRNFMLGGLMSLFFFSTMPGFFLCLALFLQVGFEFSPLKSGLTTVPFSLGVLIASLISGRLGTHGLKLRVIGGVIVLGIGIFWLRAYVLSVENAVSHWAVFLPLLTGGLGLGVAIASIFQLVLSGVPHDDAGAASGALQAVQQLGGAFGIAVVSQIFFPRLAALMDVGSGLHMAYVEAFSRAMIYNLAGYIVVVFMAVLLSPGKTEQNNDVLEEPAHLG